MSFRHEVGLCLADPLQRIRPCHERDDLAVLEVADEVAEHLGILRRAAEERQVLEVERPQVELDTWATDRAEIA